MNEESLDLLNSHFPPGDRLVRPDVTFAAVKPGAPTQLHLDGVRLNYPILRDSITVQRVGSANVLTLSIIVGEVNMDAKTRPAATDVA